MSSNDMNVKVFDLQLFIDDEDEEDIAYKQKLQSLVNGTVTPSQAATGFDHWIVEGANNRLKWLEQRVDPRSLTAEEEESGMTMRVIAPNASGKIEMVFPTIARLSTAFPPFHPGQDAIVQFLEALRALPEHQVPDGIPSEDPSSRDYLMTLWPFGGNWMALAEHFRREADTYSYPYSDIETLGSETRYRWRNFQSAIARITALGLIDCSFLSALGDIVPSSRNYVDLEQRKVGGPNRLAGCAVAAAQWVMWPGEGLFVYQQCKKVEKVSGPRDMWSRERWELWKEQFTFVSEDERFDPEARLVCKLSREQMIGYEEEDGI
ncbi:uncharacterized protein JN550_000432 [Neoarthrinium moseri]|uniref:uncharacterized protein n=1 Tax=Neoarthrinium moseri TaxID=1658444 RepID=UPI001FDC4E1D|nr:uncharacterized protein JN550_000432 [Neoarthrinium moseri]KAI1878250.1 hypothetical protein JN550_000432 [Neoarthrinium moseri]